MTNAYDTTGAPSVYYTTYSKNNGNETYTTSNANNNTALNDFSTIFANLFGEQSSFQQSSINNSRSMFTSIFGNDNTSYTQSGDVYNHQTQTSSYNYQETDQPYAVFNNDYRSKLNNNQVPSHHYPITPKNQPDCPCYEPLQLTFPSMPTYGYKPNPSIPCPPGLAPAPYPTTPPTPMPMPTLGEQMRPFGRPQAKKYPPAPHFPVIRNPAPAPPPPASDCQSCH
jgi:hypothetical protein